MPRPRKETEAFPLPYNETEAAPSGGRTKKKLGRFPLWKVVKAALREGRGGPPRRGSIIIIIIIWLVEDNNNDYYYLNNGGQWAQIIIIIIIIILRAPNNNNNNGAAHPPNAKLNPRTALSPAFPAHNPNLRGAPKNKSRAFPPVEGCKGRITGRQRRTAPAEQHYYYLARGE